MLTVKTLRSKLRLFTKLFCAVLVSVSSDFLSQLPKTRGREEERRRRRRRVKVERDSLPSASSSEKAQEGREETERGTCKKCIRSCDYRIIEFDDIRFCLKIWNYYILLKILWILFIFKSRKTRVVGGNLALISVREGGENAINAMFCFLNFEQKIRKLKHLDFWYFLVYVRQCISSASR